MYIFVIAAFIVGYCFLKWILLPWTIPSIIEWIPLKKDPQFHYVNVVSFTDYGLDVQLIVTILYTKLLLSFLFLKASIPSITIKDIESGLTIANITFSSDIELNGLHDTTVKQNLKIHLADHVHGLKQLLKKVLIGGERELKRLTFRLEFKLSLNFNGLLTVSNMMCGKTVNLEVVESMRI
jgi:hypothetical protein